MKLLKKDDMDGLVLDFGQVIHLQRPVSLTFHQDSSIAKRKKLNKTVYFILVIDYIQNL